MAAAVKAEEQREAPERTAKSEPALVLPAPFRLAMQREANLRYERWRGRNTLETLRGNAYTRAAEAGFDGAAMMRRSRLFARQYLPWMYVGRALRGWF